MLVAFFIYVILYLIMGLTFSLYFATVMSDKNFNTMSILFFWPAYASGLFVLLVINFCKLFKDACKDISNLIK